MICIKCSNPIPSTSRSVKYCSKHCQKLFLKAGWRRRHLVEQREYHRNYRKSGAGVLAPMSSSQLKKFRDDKCLKCGSQDDLQAAHIKPRTLGGTHDKTVTFCRKHHMRYDNLLREFWYNED